MRFDIPESELQWHFDPSGGPGGQHANKSATRVELRFDVGASRAFDRPTRDHIVNHLGSKVRIVEGGSRSQTTNRKRALRRLHAMLEDAARPEPPVRKATRPSLASRRRRLEMKRTRGRLKRQRSGRYEDS